MEAGLRLHLSGEDSCIQTELLIVSYSFKHLWGRYWQHGLAALNQRVFPNG